MCSPLRGPPPPTHFPIQIISNLDSEPPQKVPHFPAASRPGVSPMYTWGTHVNQLFVFLLLIYLLLEGSQPRTQKGREKIIFPFLQSQQILNFSFTLLKCPPRPDHLPL